MKITIEQPDVPTEGELTHVTVEYGQTVYELDTRAQAFFGLETTRRVAEMGSIRDQPVYGLGLRFDVVVGLKGLAETDTVQVRRPPTPLPEEEL